MITEIQERIRKAILKHQSLKQSSRKRGKYDETVFSIEKMLELSN